MRNQSGLKFLKVMFLLLFVMASVAAKVTTCNMCGKEINPKIEVSLSYQGKSETYCCPHCAIMMLSVLREKESVVPIIRLTDYLSGEKVSDTEAFVVVDEKKAICCAPAIFAFVRKNDAEQFAAKEGGKVSTFQDAAAELLHNQCGFCKMMVYPPTALKLFVKGSKTPVYGCCPVCALGMVYKKAESVTVEHYCEECSKSIKFVVKKDGQLEKESEVVVFQGLKDDNGTMKPKGCHFNHIFCTENCASNWLKKNKSPQGRLMKLPEALKVVESAYKKQQGNG